MPKNKIGLQFDGWTDYMERLDKLGGSQSMKNATEKALIASKEYVNPQIEKAVANSNLPARGKYATGQIKKSINTDKKVEWSAMTGEIKVGFDFDKSGVTSIFLMYGTPRMKPVKGLKNAIYGTKTKKQIAQIQEAEVLDVIKSIMGG